MRRFLSVLWAMLACSGPRPPATVDFGEVLVEGTVDVDYFLAQLPQLDPRFEACYVLALRQDRSVEGTMALSVKGAGTQLTPEITVNGTNSEVLSECVVGVIAGLELVLPESTVEPWDFTADWTLEFTIIRAAN